MDYADVASGVMQRRALDRFYEMDFEKAQETLGTLMQATSFDTPGWQQTQRDTCMAVTSVMLSAVRAHPMFEAPAVVDMYAQAVKNLSPDAEYFTAPHSMIELGEMVAERLGQTADTQASYRGQMVVREAWSAYHLHATDPDSATFGHDLTEALIPRILPAESEDDDSWEWSRQRPKLKGENLAIHDYYLDEVRRNKSFKPYLHRHGTAFAETARGYGLDIAACWNTQPASVALGVLSELGKQATPAQQQRFDALLRTRCGMDRTALLADESLPGVMADEIVAAAQDLRTELAQAQTPPMQLLTRLRQQAAEALEARRPARKIKPVRNFLSKLGYDTDMSVHDIHALLMDDNAAPDLQQRLETYSADRQRLLDYLDGFAQTLRYQHLRAMSRDESDLYSGDISRDCTAYHLTNGFNAWTMARWTANPGFMMFYVPLGNRWVAKMGAVLAVDDQQRPRLVVDSIEAAKGVSNPTDGIMQINRGIRDLQAWADERNLGDVLFCTYTNSSRLVPDLPLANNAHPPKSLHLLGDTQGLTAIRDALLPLDGPEAERRGPASPGYLQSHANEDNEDETIDAFGVLEDFLRPRVHNPKTQEAARTGHWPTFFQAFMQENFPFMHATYGGDWELYKETADLLYKQQEGFGEVYATSHNELLITEDIMDRIIPRTDAERTMDITNKTLTRHMHDRMFVRELRCLMDAQAKHIFTRETGGLDKMFDILVGTKADLADALNYIFGEHEEAPAQENEQAKLTTIWPIIDREQLRLMEY